MMITNNDWMDIKTVFKNNLTARNVRRLPRN